MNSSRSSFKSFYQHLPATSRLKLYVAIFSFYAATYLLLIVELFGNHGPWYRVLAFTSFSGVIGVAFALSVIRSRKFLIVVTIWFILINVAMYIRVSHFAWSVQLGPEYLWAIFLIVLGYVLFIDFINRDLRLQTEIGLAQQVHSHLVPRISLSNPQLEVLGQSLASSEVGGDLIDAVQAQGKLGVYIADVSGHGVSAGVFMSMVKSAIRMKLLHSDALDSVLDDLNQVIHQVKEPGMFVTLACMKFDTTSNVYYSLAGHPPILHYDSKLKIVRELSTQHPALGLLADHRFGVEKLKSASGDLFVLITDGLIEVEGERDIKMGTDRIKAIIQNQSTRSLPDLYYTIVSEVQARGRQTDDQTMIIIRIL